VPTLVRAVEAGAKPPVGLRLGDGIDRAEYQGRQARVARDLDALPADAPASDKVGERLAASLAEAIRSARRTPSRTAETSQRPGLLVEGGDE
jgi:hypothetical protein